MKSGGVVGGGADCRATLCSKFESPAVFNQTLHSSGVDGSVLYYLGRLLHQLPIASNSIDGIRTQVASCKRRVRGVSHKGFTSAVLYPQMSERWNLGRQ